MFLFDAVDDEISDAIGNIHAALRLKVQLPFMDAAIHVPGDRPHFNDFAAESYLQRRNVIPAEFLFFDGVAVVDNKTQDLCFTVGFFEPLPGLSHQPLNRRDPLSPLAFDLVPGVVQRLFLQKLGEWFHECFSDYSAPRLIARDGRRAMPITELYASSH